MDAPLVGGLCGAIPHELTENQFFGYERGAFTGATQTYVGFIEVAAEETLFLDARQIVQRQLHVAPTLALLA